MKLKKILIIFLLIFSTSLKGKDENAGKFRLHNNSKKMLLRIWFWNTRGVRYFRELKPGEKNLIEMQTKGLASSDVKDIVVDVYYKSNNEGNYRGTYLFKDNINIKNKHTTNLYFSYNTKKTFPLIKSIKIYKWGDGNKYDTQKTGYDNNCSIQIQNNTNKDLTIDFENAYKIIKNKNLTGSKNKRQTTIKPGSTITVASPGYNDINPTIKWNNTEWQNKFSDKKIDVRKNKKTYVYFRETNEKLERRQHVDGKTVENFRTIEQGRLVLHNEDKDMIMKFTIPNLDNDQKKPNELTLTPGKSGEIAIGKRALGLGAHNVQLRINTYNGTIFKGTFEWNKEINIKKGEFTHVFFKWNKDKIIKLRRKLYKPTKEDDVRFLKDNLIDQNYGHTAGGMGVIEFENKTGKNIKIFSSTGKSGSFTQNIEVQLKPNQIESFPTGNKDNDLIDMVAMIVGKENNARYWSKNITVRENKISKITFDLNNNGSLYRHVQEAKNILDTAKKLVNIKDEDREYGKKYSPGITYRIHNNSGKDISLEIRYSDIAKGAKIGGVVVGIAVLTAIAFYATLAVPSSTTLMMRSLGPIYKEALAAAGKASGLIFRIALNAGIKGKSVSTAITTAKGIAGMYALSGSSGVYSLLKNIDSLDSKIGFIGEIKKSTKITNEDAEVPETIGSKTSNGFIVALPKDCTFWGFEAKDIHDIKVTSYIDGNKIYYDDQHKFKIYEKFHPNNTSFSKLNNKDSKKIDTRRGGDKITEIRINPDFSVYASEPIEKKDHKDSDGNNYYKENGFYADRNFLQKLKLI
jgi:hypothetical protein